MKFGQLVENRSKNFWLLVVKKPWNKNFFENCIFEFFRTFFQRNQIY